MSLLTLLSIDHHIFACTFAFFRHIKALLSDSSFFTFRNPWISPFSCFISQLSVIPCFPVLKLKEINLISIMKLRFQKQRFWEFLWFPFKYPVSFVNNALIVFKGSSMLNLLLVNQDILMAYLIPTLNIKCLNFLNGFLKRNSIQACLWKNHPLLDSSFDNILFLGLLNHTIQLNFFNIF